jgi:hypothetical protein
MCVFIYPKFKGSTLFLTEIMPVLPWNALWTAGWMLDLRNKTSLVLCLEILTCITSSMRKFKTDIGSTPTQLAFL